MDILKDLMKKEDMYRWEISAKKWKPYKKLIKMVQIKNKDTFQWVYEQTGHTRRKIT